MDALDSIAGTSAQAPGGIAITLFAVGEAPNHHVGNTRCPECWEEYPEPCRCGGLMHAAGGAEEDADGNTVITTRCDRCGRSEDQLDQALT